MTDPKPQHAEILPPDLTMGQLYDRVAAAGGSYTLWAVAPSPEPTDPDDCDCCEINDYTAPEDDTETACDNCGHSPEEHEPEERS